jgi:hypothetical protein
MIFSITIYITIPGHFIHTLAKRKHMASMRTPKEIRRE